MNLQEVTWENNTPPEYSADRYVCVTGGVAVSGSGGSQIANGTSAEINPLRFDRLNYVGANTACVWAIPAAGAVYNIVEIGMALSSAGSSSCEYNPELVSRVRHADARVPEATFNNVIDMLGWLERD
jgi:hypothetical protein